jgi:hypothetical protein
MQNNGDAGFTFVRARDNWRKTMSTVQLRNAVVRSSITGALAALLCAPLGVLQASPSNPKPAAPSKPSAPSKPAGGGAKPASTGAKPSGGVSSSPHAATSTPHSTSTPHTTASTPHSTTSTPHSTTSTPHSTTSTPHSTTSSSSGQHFGTGSSSQHTGTTNSSQHGTTAGSSHTGTTTKSSTTSSRSPSSTTRSATTTRTTTKSVDHVTTTKSGAQVHRDAGGHVSVVHARGMDIHHGPGGARTIVRTRAGGVRVVSNRFGHGYIGHPFAYRGVGFERRTYFYNGRVYGAFYHPYTYWGVGLGVYAPGFYFAPAFYGWAYYPWAAPVAWGWGWAGNPWYGYYGAYFTPYPVYASPALWLTDYYVSQTLQAAYAERAAELANAQLDAPAPISQDVKDAIAEEVRRQISLERSEAVAGAQNVPDPGSSGIARLLTDNTTHVFVVSAPLDVPVDGGTCGVTEGDVLQLQAGTAADSSAANMVVLASKGQDCQKGATVQVGLADLQEMQNHMRETIDQGLGDLRTKQGQNGIPAAPAGAAAAPVQTGFAAIAPPDDPNVKSDLSDTAKEGDQADKQALSESGGPNNEGGGAAPTATVQMGQTVAEVIAILGQPLHNVDMGAKKIYVYKDLKITFVDGKVTVAE